MKRADKLIVRRVGNSLQLIMRDILESSYFLSCYSKKLPSLPTKGRLVKVMVFPVVMYGRESRTIKKAECQRIDAFEPWCWNKLLRDTWTARRSNQSILKEISPGFSLEGLMLKLKLLILWPPDGKS